MQLVPAFDLLNAGLNEIQVAYQPPIAVLVPRPGILLIGHVVSSIYLLEHAIWGYTTGKPTHLADVEVFRRWTLEFGLAGVLEDVEVARTRSNERTGINSLITYPNTATMITPKL